MSLAPGALIIQFVKQGAFPPLATRPQGSNPRFGPQTLGQTLGSIEILAHCGHLGFDHVNVFHGDPIAKEMTNSITR
jgi:hypothetical protein